MPRKKSNKGKGSKKGSKKKASPTKKAEPVLKVETKLEVEDIKMDVAEDEAPSEQHHPKAALRREIDLAMMLALQAVETKEFSLFARVIRHVNSVRKKQTPALLSWTIHKYHLGMKASIADYAAQVTAENEEDAKKTVELAAAAKAKAAEDAKKAKLEEAKKAKEKAASDKKSSVSEDEAKTKEAAKAAKSKEEKEAKAAELKKKKAKEEAMKQVEATKLPEVQAVIHLMTCMFLIDQKKTEVAATCAKNLVDFVQPLNRRSMDVVSAKVYYFYCLTHESLGQLDSIRGALLRLHRTAALQHNEPGQAALVVCILRSFLQYKLYQQADKFRLNTTLPESRSNDIHARYLFYIGQINAVQLQYSDAFNHLTQAVRKAPQNSALGFRQMATKLLVIVQLLMGEIPERGVFFAAQMKHALKPYFSLAQAVRVGDLHAFEQVATEHKAVWERDHVTSLIARLRNNVIKTGLRKINLSYSRISLSDVCSKLNLDSVDDAEYIVSKCIHDGVIDAVIDHDKKFMFSQSQSDKYATHAPQAHFHKRVMFCMEIRNEAVKALRFPHSASTKDDSQSLLDDDEVVLEADAMDD